ncbi:MAG: NAD(P)/FAD-dependent oxidoreductase [Symploca sp. SIO1C4]|uniref:NADH:ubiquinone reductase (non-electrogenic) n=1 Tax=Symploca sp. SIO1C4 TaxID=2607765 RepID=A0A6B3MXP4_9CYAN|nr:NAD(P)/FAD-dependent oxidoreductase [Symploca sp. SIO1C4]
MKKKTRVVIVGAGFGGLQAAQSLAETEVEVLLINRDNYHTFVPLLYQVATSGLSPDLIAIPIRNLLRRSHNTRFLQAEVKEIDFVAKLLQTSEGIISYDFLILATGSRTQFFGIPGAADHAFPLRTLADAVSLRNQIIHCFEKAEDELDGAKRQQLLTIAIVGGGATGVELAGALVELVLDSLQKDYPRLNPHEVNLILLQSGERLLAEFPQSLGKYTYRRLRQLGVQVMLNSKVCRVSANGVRLQDNTWLSAATVIWSVGLAGTIPTSSSIPTQTHKGKIQVLPSLQVSKYPEVFAIGDLAHLDHNQKPLSGVAPEALQEGVFVARNIQRKLRGQKLKPFSYFNKGRLAIIGCYSGVGKIGFLQLKGFLPWFMWLAVHLVYLPDWRNRLLILLSWLHAYIVGDRSVRLILSNH